VENLHVQVWKIIMESILLETKIHNFNQGAKRPAQCYANGIVFEEENSEKIIAIMCNCGRKHPVEHSSSYGSTTGFEAVVDDTKEWEIVNWEKEFGYKPGYFQQGNY